jgi:cell division protein FtsQ
VPERRRKRTVRRPKKKAAISSRLNRKHGALLMRAALLVLVAASLGAAVYTARHSSAFAVEEVTIEGNTRLSDGEIRALMGMDQGENLFSLSSASLVESLTSSPWVVEALVRKEFPHALLVTVEEAVPRALLQTERGTFLIDERGRELEKLAGEPEPFLPVIVDRVGSRQGAFGDALALAAFIQKSSISAPEHGVEIHGFQKGPERISMILDGLTVRVGKGRYEEKLARLVELRDEIERREIVVDYVDLRFADRVVVKPVSNSVRGRKAVGHGR